MPGESESLIVQPVNMNDPLYYNPNTSAVKITPPLSESENYIPWRRQMELALSSKRKLGYVTGSVKKPTTDEAKIEDWNSNNSLVISWIIDSVTAGVKMCILYTETAHEIWEILQRRYTQANGARKYRIVKDTFELMQGDKSVEEYHTQLQIKWDELENLTVYPAITHMTDEFTSYLRAVDNQAQERKLFKFLNGLDTSAYGQLRSNILLMNPLPTVDAAVQMIMQEETQRNTLEKSQPSSEMTALMSKGESVETECKHCGLKNHKPDFCYEVRGYPPGHPKAKRNNQSHGQGYGQGYGQGNQGYFNQQRNGQGKGRNYATQGNYNQGRNFGNRNNYNNNNNNRNNYGYNGAGRRVANNAQSDQCSQDFDAALASVNQQLQTLMRSVPSSSNNSRQEYDTDEEIDCNFAGLHYP